MSSEELVSKMKGMSAEEMVSFIHEITGDKDLAQSFESMKFVRNEDFDLQHITAHTFRLLTYKAGRTWTNWRGEVRYSEEGWTEGFHAYYTFDYCMHYLDKITKRMARLQKENQKMFGVEMHFFNQDVITATLETYADKLAKYLKSLPVKKCMGRPYVKVGAKHLCDKTKDTDKCGMMFVENLVPNFILPILSAVEQIKREQSFAEINKIIKQILRHKVYFRLNIPADSCKEFVDAFKGRGAYFTLQNLIRHSGVKIAKKVGYAQTELLDMYQSLNYLDIRLDTDKGNYYKLLGLLKSTIEENKFDFYKLMEEKYNNK